MTKALLMAHDHDPRDEITHWFAQFDDQIFPMTDEVLVAVYRRPERTRGGLYVPDQTKREDDIQGKVGLVLKLGPLAFTEDADHRWGDRVPVVGDWVLFNIGDTFAFELESRRCRMVREGNVRAILQEPDLVW